MRTILTLALFFSLNANANFVDGNMLNKWFVATEKIDAGDVKYSDPEAADSAMLGGYLLGVADAGRLGSYWKTGNYTKDSSLFCLPKGIQVAQLGAAVKKYIRARPEEWNESAGILIGKAFAVSFPCESKFDPSTAKPIYPIRSPSKESKQ